ncbi:hypothetical protein [Frankia sp. Cj5]|uniref:hypothetical protein n=1 Tax=Frankia sp. Cj5 TaxID=2880978 RepID=UPI001EF416D5|nr:hypothetical protein [Frankia sp. Cj5]
MGLFWTRGSAIRRYRPLKADNRTKNINRWIREAREAGARDAAANFPDAEVGGTRTPYERAFASHNKIIAGDLGAGYAFAWLNRKKRVIRAVVRMDVLKQSMADHDQAVTDAETTLTNAWEASKSGPDSWRRLLAHLPGQALLRLVIAGSIIIGEAVALKPTLDILGQSYWITYFLVVTVVGAGLLIATAIARHLKEKRLEPVTAEAGLGRHTRQHQSAGQPDEPAGWLQRPRDLFVWNGTTVLVAMNVFVALVRAQTFVADADLLRADNIKVGVDKTGAFCMFLSLQVAFTFAVAFFEYQLHDPRAATVRGAAWALRRSKAWRRFARLRHAWATRRLRIAEAAAQAENRAAEYLAQREAANIGRIRDAYRDSMVNGAAMDPERAAALAEIPYEDYPAPEFRSPGAPEPAEEQAPTKPADSPASGGPSSPSPSASPNGKSHFDQHSDNTGPREGPH